MVPEKIPYSEAKHLLQTIDKIAQEPEILDLENQLNGIYESNKNFLTSEVREDLKKIHEEIYGTYENGNQNN